MYSTKGCNQSCIIRPSANTNHKAIIPKIKFLKFLVNLLLFYPFSKKNCWSNNNFLLVKIKPWKRGWIIVWYIGISFSFKRDENSRKFKQAVCIPNPCKHSNWLKNAILTRPSFTNQVNFTFACKIFWLWSRLKWMEVRKKYLHKLRKEPKIFSNVKTKLIWFFETTGM